MLKSSFINFYPEFAEVKKFGLIKSVKRLPSHEGKKVDVLIEIISSVLNHFLNKTETVK